MRRWRKVLLWVVAIFCFLVVTAPLVAIESLYRYELSKIDGRPKAGETLTVDQVREISDCFRFTDITPIYPWTSFNGLLHPHSQSMLPGIVARYYLSSTSHVHLKNLDWTLHHWALTVWVSRHMDRAEAISSLGPAPFPDMRIDLLLKEHVCSPGNWRRTAKRS